MPTDARGRLNGLFVGIFFIGGAVGSLLAGVAWSWGGWTWVCSIGAALGLAAQLVDWIVVMYAGQVVETGTPATVLGDPRHPYTIGLIRAQLSLEEPGRPSTAIPGVVPAPSLYPEGCRFRSRCSRALDRCIERPTLAPAGASGRLACHNPGSLDAP